MERPIINVVYFIFFVSFFPVRFPVPDLLCFLEFQAYNGDDYNGARIVSRAYELRDAVRSLHLLQNFYSYYLRLTFFLHFIIFNFFIQVHGMLSQMDPALVAYCDKIAAQGGPANIPDDIGVSTLSSVPVVQLGTVTRASARLRHVQPEANPQSYEALKRPKKNADTVLSGIFMSVMSINRLPDSPLVYDEVVIRFNS